MGMRFACVGHMAVDVRLSLTGRWLALSVGPGSLVDVSGHLHRYLHKGLI